MISLLAMSLVAAQPAPAPAPAPKKEECCCKDMKDKGKDDMKDMQH